MNTPGHAGGAQHRPVRLAVIGSGRHARDLAAQHPWGYPFVGRHAVITACAPLEGAAGTLETIAQRTGARLLSSWREVIAASDVDAVLLLAPPAQRPELARAAIEAGRGVLCPAPLAPGARQMHALTRAISGRGSQAVLVAGGALAHTPAGRNALDVLASGTRGRIESTYAAVRWHARDVNMSAGHMGLPDAAWDVLDFVLEALDAPLTRVYAHAARLFDAGDTHDTVVSIMRFANDTVFSFEAAACLPSAIATPDAGEIELELIGAHETLRLEPYQSAVSVASTAAPDTHLDARTHIDRRDWVEPPIAGMLRTLLAAMCEPARALDTLARQHRLAALADAMAASIESAQPVEAIAPSTRRP